MLLLEVDVREDGSFKREHSSSTEYMLKLILDLLFVRPSFENVPEIISFIASHGFVYYAIILSVFETNVQSYTHVFMHVPP